MKLLIADDQISLHRYLNKVMDWEALGFTEVRHAYDGEEAAAEVVSFRPDLMILDIHMPTLNGLESLKRVRESGYAPKTIILSAYDQFEYAREALHLQVSHYLLKPVDAGQLKQVLADMVQQSVAAARGMVRVELDRLLYSGGMETESLATIRQGFASLGIWRFAVMTVMDHAEEGDGSRWIEEQAEGLFRCVLSVRKKREHVLLIGGQEELSDGTLRAFCDAVQRYMADASMAPLSFGLSAIAEDAANLPQAIAESAQAASAPGETGAGLQETIWRIKLFIDNHYDEDLTLQAVADRFNIDRYQLSRAFKKEFGVNYWSQVTKVRMEKAAELLAGTDWKNSRIAEKTGFLDESHFSRTFKKFYGVTPTAYRRQQTSCNI